MSNDPGVPAFGGLLRRLRERRKLSQGQVRNHLKTYGLTLSRAGMSRYESGERPAPDPAVLYVMAKCYGVELSDLVSALVAERAGKPVADIQMIERPGELSPRALQLARHFDDLDDRSQLALFHLMELGTRKPRRVARLDDRRK